MNDKKINIGFTTLPFFLTLWGALSMIISCSSTITSDEIWEGIHGNTLRVFVSIDTAPDPDSDDVKYTPHDIVLRAGRNRAGTLMLSYARAHLSDSQRIEACRQAIPVILEKESLRFMRCSDEACTAVFDFNVEKFLEAAGSNETRQ